MAIALASLMEASKAVALASIWDEDKYIVVFDVDRGITHQ